MATGYMNSPERLMFDERGVFRRTSTAATREHTIHWPSALEPVPLQREIKLLRSGTLVRRGDSDHCKVQLECSGIGITYAQATSIRNQLLAGKA